MTIQFNCTGCGESIAAPDLMAGTQASCNNCGATLTVPQPGAAPAKPAQVAKPVAAGGGNPLVDGEYTAPLGAAKPNSGASLKYGTLGGVACLLALLTMVIFMTGGTQRVIAGGGRPNFRPNENRPDNANGEGDTGTSSDSGSGSGANSGSAGAPKRPNAGTTSGANSSNTPSAGSGNTSSGGNPTSGSGNATTNNSSTPATASSGSTTGSGSPAAGGPAIPDIVKQAAANNGIPQDVIDKAFGKDGSAGGSGDNAEAVTNPGAGFAEWRVEPDPPIEPVAYKVGRINVTIPDNSKITYPRAESNFVLVHLSSFGKHAAQMVDLRTGEFVGGTVTDELPYGSDLEASADGKHLAVKKRGSTISFGVWSMENGRLLNDFTFTREQDAETPHFMSADRIAFVNDPFSTEPLKIFVYSLGDGGSIAEFSIPLTREVPLLKNTFTVSHSGAYASIIRNDVLSMISLENGQILGEARLPAKPKECVGMAYSPDGGELAGLFNFDSGSRLIVWDMRTGNPMVDSEYDEQLSAFFTSSKKPVVNWAPDKSAIMLGRQFIMDTETGKKVWQLPDDAARNPVKFVRPFELLTMQRDTAKRKQAITAVKLPRKEIDKIVAEVRSGGSQIDASLPPLTSADLFAAVPKSHPTTAPSWSVQPDTVEANPRLKMERTTLVAATGTELKRVLLPGLSGKLLTLRNSSGKAWLEKFDLLRAKRASQTQLPEIYDLLDANSDGGQALIGVKAQRIVRDGIFNSTAKGFDRLDVVATEGKKHICGWRPYGGESEVDDQIVQWAKFVDDTHVATINSRGKLVLWQLPECKAQYMFKDFGKPAAISNGHKYVLSTTNDSIRLYDLLTGDCAGELETPPNGVDAVRAGFRQDGKELAAVIKAGRDHTLARWSLETGELTHNFPLHPAVPLTGLVTSTGTLQDLDYRGDDYVLIDHRYLLNLTRRAVIWRYNLPTGRHIAASPDGRHWYLAPYQTSSGPWHANAITMPGNTVTAAAEFNKLEDQLALYPGMKVAVHVQLGAAAGSLTANDIGKGIAAKLAAKGFVVDPQNPQVHLTLSTSRGSTGEQLSVNSGYTPGFGGGSSNGGGSFNQEKVTCTLKLTDREGKQLWGTSRDVQMRSIGIVNNNDVQGQLQAEMLRSVEGLLRDGNIVDVSLPQYVFKDISVALSGESDMTLAGEGQRVSPVERKRLADEAARRARERASQQPSRSGPGMSPGGFPSGGGRIPTLPGRGGFPSRPGLPSRGGFPGVPGRGSPF